MRRNGFSLIELLTVIGIAALLASLVIPAAAGVRAESNRMICQGNVRQIVAAMLAYAECNRDVLPSPSPAIAFEYDWIHWQVGRNLAQSAIARYMTVTPRALRCPSDDVASRPRLRSGAGGAYEYSYAMNQFLGVYGDRAVPLKTSRIKRPSQMILLVEEEGTCIDDGMWCASAGQTDYLSTVHDRDSRREKQHPTASRMVNPRARGVVGMLDGHVEYLAKRDAHHPRYHNPYVPR
jgi:prepilin-type N-terminal cleavage/methylation domain-containing protein